MKVEYFLGEMKPGQACDFWVEDSAPYGQYDLARPINVTTNDGGEIKWKQCRIVGNPERDIMIGKLGAAAVEVVRVRIEPV
jgi:hypothetical protein